MVATPNRRWYQFSLRAVFVGMTLLSFGLAVWLKCIEPAERQRAMARRVERLGGYVRYADAPSDERWPLPTLRQWLPRDYFDALTEINLDTTEAKGTKVKIAKATDDDLADLSQFPHLQELWLNGTDVTDATLKKLADLRQLRVVNLRGTKVTDEGLAAFAHHSQLQILNLRESKLTGTGLTHLKDLSHLQILNLRDTDVDDDATKSLAGLEELQSLFLDGTRVTDQQKTELRAALPKCDITPENRATLEQRQRAQRQFEAVEFVENQAGRVRYDRPIPAASVNSPQLMGEQLPNVIAVDFVVRSRDPIAIVPIRLAHLREFSRLKFLDLSGTSVPDDQLIYLASCTELERLNLANTQITDAGLLHVAELMNLKSLMLHNTVVTDCGLERLTSLKRLSLLSLGKTQVTDDGVEKLQQALPSLKIVRQ